jgi:riboflavin synthase alpha subunit
MAQFLCCTLQSNKDGGGDHTTLGGISEGRRLNLEIDVLARYLKRMAEARA